MRTASFLGLTCVLCLALACGDDDESSPDAGARDAGPDASGGGSALTVATYNAGLLDSVGYVPERAPLTIAAVAELDADIVCVQEFWQQEHWDALVDASADAWPHVLRPDPQPGVQGQCTPEEFAPVLSCAQDKCADAGPSGLVSCTAGGCAAEVGAVSASCVTCLLDNGGSGDFALIEDACVGAGSSMAGPLEPAERSYSLGGSFGIGLLSRYPFAATDTKVLDASAVRRGILYARVDTPDHGELSVFCTHTTPDLPSTSYDGSYGSWKGENEAHIEALIDFVNEQAKDEPVVALGDLNTGPAGDDFNAELPDSYAKLPKAGFEDPFVEGPDARCTFCSENALVKAGDTGVGAILDHVLVRDLDGSVSVERILTDEVAIEAADGDDAGAGRAPARLPLSDHYGLRAVIR